MTCGCGYNKVTVCACSWSLDIIIVNPLGHLLPFPSLPPHRLSTIHHTSQILSKLATATSDSLLLSQHPTSNIIITPNPVVCLRMLYPRRMLVYVAGTHCAFCGSYLSSSNSIQSVTLRPLPFILRRLEKMYSRDHGVKNLEKP